MKKQLLTLILFTFTFVCFNQYTYAVPATPYPVTITLPNGENITVFLKGDESINWMESEDGYTLMYDDNKYIVYAIQDENGQMRPSSVKAQNIDKRSDEVKAFLNEIPKKLRYSKEQRNTLLQIREMGEEIIQQTSSNNDSDIPQNSVTAKVGTAKAICALVQFPDKPMIYSQNDFDQLMNQVGYNKDGQVGSVRDYYFENSYGKLTLEVTVVGPYTTANNHDYYGNEEEIYGGRLAKEIAAKAFADVNPANFDNDNDGFIDTFHFIFAGRGEETSGDENDIWSHKWNISPVQTYGTKKLNTYSCSPELRGGAGNNMTRIGVISHELCHVLGAPDFYDANGETGGEFTGTGSWDLMADGCWLGDGATPSHINMYQKIQFGWVDPIELNEPIKINGMLNSAANPVAYIINTNNKQEYFVLENRQKVGYDSKIPGTGLLIYHVNVTSSDITYNRVNNAHPQKVYPVNAGSKKQVPILGGVPDDYGLINSASCAFKGLRSAFTDESLPASFSWSGGKIGKPITDITEEDQKISFKFMIVDEVAININYSIDKTKKRVTVSWTTENVNKAIKSYNIYRNDEFLLNTSNATFTQTYNADQIKYGVQIVYNDETISYTEEVIINTNVAIDKIADATTSIYPNPVQKGTNLIVDLADCNQADLFIYDISGRLVVRDWATTQQTSLFIDLPSGMYIMKIVKEQGFEIIKFRVW
ncbi:M6 family metalloprotease domain-containing protein [Bacteroidales bacterium OttesenSCG-928-M11]|nr:M6 family metalloprotease domain-containing protein [Bacteroidales bacterium OttesenSCG-928-M11]